MEIKDKKTAAKVEQLMEESNELYDKKKFEPSIAKLIAAWETLPLPKEGYDESFHIAQGLADTYFLVKNFDEALVWAKKLATCDPERQDDGDSELLQGKALYEMGNMEEAKQNFQTAFQKSEGRIFSSVPKKYVDLLKQK